MLRLRLGFRAGLRLTILLQEQPFNQQRSNKCCNGTHANYIPHLRPGEPEITLASRVWYTISHIRQATRTYRRGDNINEPYQHHDNNHSSRQEDYVISLHLIKSLFNVTHILINTRVYNIYIYYKKSIHFYKYFSKTNKIKK